MECARCRHDNAPTAKFCQGCGRPLLLTCARCRAPLSSPVRFCPECGFPVGSSAATRFGSPDVYTPSHLAERILTSKAAVEGERKQVTVLFADVKGSMELLAHRDPEEAQGILDPVLTLMMDAVHRYEGTVNQVLGDGIMALFGAPMAHEDHALRACYAALTMQEALRRYADEVQRRERVTISIRAGLNSGEVVVRAIGTDLRMDYSAVGQTTHLAARMEQLASPATTLLTGQTYRLVHGFVRVRALGQVPIKGLPEPVEVFELRGAAGPRRRFEVLAARGLAPFVGRQAELTALVEALQAARGGRGRMVAVVGEPGVGKSRLVFEFVHSPRLEGWLTLSSSAVSYGAANAFLPIADLLRQYFHLADQDDDRTIREKVTAKVLALDRSLETALPAVLTLLGAGSDDGPWQGLEPVDRRHRMFEALEGLLVRESQRQPVCLVLEDLQWIDSETQAFLDRFVQSLAGVPVLLIVSYRPEHDHSWPRGTPVTTVPLAALPADGARQLLQALLGRDAALEPVERLLIERTGGNPLFLEECVRALIETGTLTGERGAYRLAAPVGDLPVPESVQAILAARLDRLAADDKRVLQAASALGGEFPATLLEAVVDITQDDLLRAVQRLRARGFLDEVGLYPEIAYAFTHALLLDVAYGSLVRDRRRELDGRIVEAIERRYGDRLTLHVDRLAHHAFRGEVWSKAVGYCREASARALARSAFADALHYADQALVALARLGAVAERETSELELLTQRGAALRALHGYAASAVERVYLRTRELRGSLGDTTGRFALDWQEMQFLLVRADLPAAGERAAGLLAFAEKRGEPALLADAHLARGMTLFHLGDFPTARDHFDHAAAICDPESDPPHLLTHGQITGVFALSYLAWTQVLLGYPHRAVAGAERALEIAGSRHHSFSQVSALTFAARVFQCTRDVERVRRVAGQLVSEAGRQRLSYYEALGSIHEGWARVLLDGDDQGLTELLDGYAALEKTGTVLGLRGALVQLAEALLRLGCRDSAVQALARAASLERGTQCWDAEIARLRAEAAAGATPPEPLLAEALYAEALQTARRQGARWLTLRVALSWVQAAQAWGRSEPLRAVLEEITAGLEEGSGAVELRAARRFLAG
ncbi:MAG TPA: AAA family ATPase [Candidatus Binatia bacterium]|nr:AAA family ATPase [Candidatus Binatia bacterium]